MSGRSSEYFLSQSIYTIKTEKLVTEDGEKVVTLKGCMFIALELL